MKKQEVVKRLSCLGLASLLTLSLAACDKQMDEQDSEPPATPTIVPPETPAPTPPIPYTDVAEDAAYYDAVVWAYKNGIASDGETFEPQSTCTRGQVITFLWRAMGSPEPQVTESPFNDVSSTDWFYEPALWAYENGIATGTAFKPGGSCTNGEALTFLWRAEDKPMAAVDSSAVALAASGAYYARPAAWADSNGLFAGADFDPAAPCSRADLMTYLYWATEKWAFTGEDKAVQAEYEQIIYDAQPYEVYGSGLIYADYVDVEGDGKVELLTVGIDDDLLITAAVYANDNGHVEKYCEGTFKTAYFGKYGGFSVGTTNGELYICSAGSTVEAAGAYYNSTSQFFKVGKGTFSLEADLYWEEEYNFEKDMYDNTYSISGKEAAENEYKEILKKYPDESMKSICSIEFGYLFIKDRGLVPTPGIEVNGTAVKLSATPYLTQWDNEFMVPLRDVLEAMGVAVYANSDASIILASTKSDTLTISNKNFPLTEGINNAYGSNKTYKYSMNGGEFQEITLEFTDGKAFVPLQTIVPLFGATVEWDGKAGAMQITANIPDSNRMTQDELKKVANFDINQAGQIAVNKGYKGPYGGAPNSYGGWRPDDYESNVNGGLVFKNGKAVWSLYAVEEETIVPYGYYGKLYRIDVTNDGTVTAYPDDKVIQAAGAV